MPIQPKHIGMAPIEHQESQRIADLRRQVDLLARRAANVAPAAVLADGSVTPIKLIGSPAPTAGQGLVWDGSQWITEDQASQADLAAEAAARVAHAALTTTAHGGIVSSADPRLADARTPAVHASSHAPGGTDDLATLLLLQDIDERRTSDCATVPSLFAQATQPYTAGTAYGSWAKVRKTQNYTRIRMVIGTTVWAGSTLARAGINDGSTRALVVQTADFSATLNGKAAGTELIVNLASTYAGVRGTVVYLSFTSVAHTAGTLRSCVTSAGQNDPTGGPRLSYTQTGVVAGASIPTLTGAASGSLPLLELLP